MLCRLLKIPKAAPTTASRSKKALRPNDITYPLQQESAPPQTQVIRAGDTFAFVFTIQPNLETCSRALSLASIICSFVRWRRSASLWA